MMDLSSISMDTAFLTLRHLALALGPYILASVFVLFVLWLLFAYFYAWKQWCKHFAGMRVSRRHSGSASNKQMPDLKPYQDVKEQILNAAENLQQDDDEVVRSLEEKTGRKTIKGAATILARKKASRVQTLTPATVVKLKMKLNNRGTITSANGINKGSLSDEVSEGLDMDHVYLSFSQLLWGYTFVGLNAHFLMVRNTTLLKLRVWLHKLGLIKPKPVDYDEFAARMCLETSMACYYRSKVGDIAGFFFPDLPYVDGDGIKKVCQLLTVYVNLKEKKMTKATFDDQQVTGRQVAQILFFYNLSANHVKIHSMANWGLNTEKSVKDMNSFLYQNSIVTVMYNHFGFTGFADYIPGWKSQGFLSDRWTSDSWIQTVTQGVSDGMFAHPNVEELVPYSRLVNFIVKTRPIFLSDFAKHRTQFPGVNGEAMYIGTVMHSLDHTCQDWACEDPLWLDVDDERFGLLAEMGRMVKVGFIKDLPGLTFHKRFKGSKHPFYAGFYEKAAKIDRKYADVMDTCIVK